MTSGVVGVKEALQNEASLGPCLPDARLTRIDIRLNMGVKHNEISVHNETYIKVNVGPYIQFYQI